VALDTEILDSSNFSLVNQATDETSRLPDIPVIKIPAVDYLNSNSMLRRPIVIPVPKGIQGDLSLQGLFVEPVDKYPLASVINSNGEICKRLDASFSPTPLKSFVIYGVEPFKANESGVKLLRPNVIQSVKPYQFYPAPPSSNSVLPYNIPLLTPNPTPDESISDFKCRNPFDRRTCTNRHLFELMVLSSVSKQVWIRQPPPPSDSLLSMRLGVPENTNPFTSLYFPRESPFLMTYESTGTFTVLVEYFKREISFSTPGGRVTQALWDCTGAGYGWVGNIPTTSSPSPSAPSACVPAASFNFSLKDLGQGFN
jgi:hypothetical protein